MPFSIAKYSVVVLCLTCGLLNPESKCDNTLTPTDRVCVCVCVSLSGRSMNTKEQQYLQAGWSTMIIAWEVTQLLSSPSFRLIHITMTNTQQQTRREMRNEHDKSYCNSNLRNQACKVMKLFTIQHMLLRAFWLAVGMVRWFLIGWQGERAIDDWKTGWMDGWVDCCCWNWASTQLSCERAVG